MKTLIAAAALIALAAPAQAQYYGSDPAVVGATTYCAARAQGRDDRQASRDAWQSTAAAGDFATLVVHMGHIRTRMTYLAKQQCPEYFGSTPVATTGNGPDYQTVPVDPEACKAYPMLAKTMWAGRCS